MDNDLLLIYKPEDFSEPLKEDMQTAYLAHGVYVQSNSDDAFWVLKNAVWQVSLTLKAYRAAGELSAAVCDEMNDYFWGFLVANEGPSNIKEGVV